MVINDPKIKETLLLGNEAVVRGALEAGVSFVTTYPGTPASEIGDTFAKIAKESGIYFEYSTNEKVALEAAAGAAFSGLAALVAMKHYGLNVALDSLLPLVYLECPLVVVVADDPGSWSSIQTEQDSRWFSRLGHIPTLEPADSQEAKEMTKFAFVLAQKYKIPVLLRLTTRVCHTRTLVKLDSIIAPKQVGNFIAKRAREKKNLFFFSERALATQGLTPFIKKEFRVGAGPTVTRHKNLAAKIKKIQEDFSGDNKFNFIEAGHDRKLGLVVSGVSFYYVKEILRQFDLSLPILKIGFSYPMLKNKFKEFFAQVDQILVVEELDPVLEREARRLVQEFGLVKKIFGKDLLPGFGEFNPENVYLALSKILNKPLPKNLLEHQKEFAKLSIEQRPPILCAGCPHRAAFWLVKKALMDMNADLRGHERGLTRKTDADQCGQGQRESALSRRQSAAEDGVVFGGDIGCYLLGALPPFNLADYIVSMGAGMGISHGVSKAAKTKPIIFIGDSTFFHAGIPALINLVYNQSDVLLVILDNRITAMTGHQPNPGMGLTGLGELTKTLKIEEIVKACQVDNLEIINVFNIEESLEKIKKAYAQKGVSVVVAKGECRLLTVRRLSQQNIKIPKFVIEADDDFLEFNNFKCPAIRRGEDNKYYIDQNICWGCSFCSQMYPEKIKSQNSKIKYRDTKNANSTRMTRTAKHQIQNHNTDANMRMNTNYTNY